MAYVIGASVYVCLKLSSYLTVKSVSDAFEQFTCVNASRHTHTHAHRHTLKQTYVLTDACAYTHTPTLPRTCQKRTHTHTTLLYKKRTHTPVKKAHIHISVQKAHTHTHTHTHTHIYLHKKTYAQVGARDAMELRDAILDAGDLRQPVNFNEQLMKNSQTVLDSEISQSLIQLLSSKRPAKVGVVMGAFCMSSSICLSLYVIVYLSVICLSSTASVRVR